MVSGRLWQLGAAIAVLAAVAGAPAAVPPQSAAPSAAASTGRSARADGRFELSSRIDPAKPMRWLACRPIEYRINTAEMPKGMIPTVQHAMGILEQQTGVRFRYAGRTGHTFDSSGHADVPTIYLAFTTRSRAAGQSFGGRSGEVGVGGPAASWSTSPDGTTEAITYGRVLLSSRFDGARTGGGVSWQALILHEVGHALNLAHRGGSRSIMHPTLTASTPARYTASEVQALHRVLQTSGCDYAQWSKL